MMLKLSILCRVTTLHCLYISPSPDPSLNDMFALYYMKYFCVLNFMFVPIRMRYRRPDRMKLVQGEKRETLSCGWKVLWYVS